MRKPGKELTLRRVMDICENKTVADEEEMIEAWQWIQDSGSRHILPAWYGRTVDWYAEQGQVTK